MFRRTFQENRPYITFTADGQQRVIGNFVAGVSAALDYDPRRIPGAETITAIYRFSANGPVASKQLEVTTGQIVERYSTELVEATMLTTTIDVPADAAELMIWFEGVSASGLPSWDSNQGLNYLFRFTSLDIQGEHGRVVSEPGAKFSAFQVEATTLPLVAEVAVNYEVINDPGSQEFRGSIPLMAGDLANGRVPWTSPDITVPNGATVRFAFMYRVEGRLFIDDNDGQGFYAPKPLPTESPAAYLAALKKRKAV